MGFAPLSIILSAVPVFAFRKTGAIPVPATKILVQLERMDKNTRFSGSALPNLGK
jgi:hypothetical protein